MQADAERKLARKKEINRNKAERKFIRDASSQKDKPEDIKKQLQEMISLEENGTLSKMQRLQKKVLQEAYDHALKRKIVSGPHACMVRITSQCINHMNLMMMRGHV